MQSNACLHFNSEAALSDYKAWISRIAADCLKDFHNEIRQTMSTAEGRSSLQIVQLDGSQYITCQVIGAAYAIMDSYGTGSLMDTGNPFLSHYVGSQLWNPVRYSNAIHGRPNGYYIDILGRKKYTSGKMSGINIETHFEPQRASYAFQRAEQWWCANNGLVTERLEKGISDYLSNMHQYFEYY